MTRNIYLCTRYIYNTRLELYTAVGIHSKGKPLLCQIYVNFIKWWIFLKVKIKNLGISNGKPEQETPEVQYYFDNVWDSTYCISASLFDLCIRVLWRDGTNGIYMYEALTHSFPQ